MEAAMIAQMQAMQQPAGVQGAAGGAAGTAASGENLAQNSMFASLLQQMLGMDGETAILGGGPQQKAMLVEQMRQQLSQDGVAAGMQLLAEMLVIHPGFVQQMNTAELAELMQQGTAQPVGGVADTMQGLWQAKTAMQGQGATDLLQQQLLGQNAATVLQQGVTTQQPTAALQAATTLQQAMAMQQPEMLLQQAMTTQQPDALFQQAMTMQQPEVILQQAAAIQQPEVILQQQAATQQAAPQQAAPQQTTVLPEVQAAVATAVQAQPEARQATRSAAGSADFNAQLLMRQLTQSDGAVTQTVQGAAESGAAQQELSGQVQSQRALFTAQQGMAHEVKSDVAEVMGTKQEDGKTEAPKADNVIPFPQAMKLEQLEKTTQLAELGEIDAKDVLQQIKTGVAKGAADGKNEFVIKLKPEGLGEITVRMIEEAGKITLSLTTSSLQTQKLLNNELATLRDAVRPYNVEVQNVESQNTQSFDLQQQQRQQFAQQNQQQREHHPQSHYGSIFDGTAEEQAEGVAQELSYAPNSLNTVV